MDFGDGTGTVPVDASNMLHTYARPGRYRITQTATDRIGRTISASAVAQVGAAFAAVAPARLLDTRNGTGAAKGRPGAHSVIRLTVTGHGVPSGATSVLLNLTAVGSAAPGYVTAYPHGRPRPTASSLDYRRGQTIANLVSVPVGANGQVDLYVSAGPVDLVADVEGYQSTAPTGPAGFFTSYLGQHGEWTNWWGAPRLAADGTRTLQVVPPELTNLQQYDMGYGATAVVLRLTVSKPGSAGYLTAYRAGTARPGTSVLNFSQGEDRSATAVVPVGPDGKVSVYAHAGRPILLSVAVEGFYAPELADSQFHVMTTPVRVLDTRTGLGHRGRLAASTDWRFRVSGAAGLPSGVTGVLVNLTAVNPTAPGSLWAWADGNHRPVEEALRYQRGQVTAGLVWLPVVNGYLRLSSDYGTLDVVADIEGYALG
jgi:hypothetical protein